MAMRGNGLYKGGEACRRLRPRRGPRRQRNLATTYRRHEDALRCSEACTAFGRMARIGQAGTQMPLLVSTLRSQALLRKAQGDVLKEGPDDLRWRHTLDTRRSPRGSGRRGSPARRVLGGARARAALETRPRSPARRRRQERKFTPSGANRITVPLARPLAHGRGHRHVQRALANAFWLDVRWLCPKRPPTKPHVTRPRTA